ncbi:hypothetical protein [Sulfitobacter sp.]|uniref:hypothetical protein n=1 Tax=Sulfitobacter sp. TaxID=1903071 RepID=UPI003F6D9EDE
MAKSWEKKHRKLIDRIKAGGYDAAIEHHTKGMLAAEAALRAAYELGMEQAGDDMHSQSAKIAGKCREMLFNLKNHHCQADNAASELMGAPVARDGSR